MEEQNPTAEALDRLTAAITELTRQVTELTARLPLVAAGPGAGAPEPVGAPATADPGAPSLDDAPLLPEPPPLRPEPVTDSGDDFIPMTDDLPEAAPVNDSAEIMAPLASGATTSSPAAEAPPVAAERTRAEQPEPMPPEPEPVAPPGVPAVQVTTTRDADDPRFEVAHRLYRKFDGVLRVIQSATVAGETVLRRGRMTVAVSVRPPLPDFAEQECAALVDEMRHAAAWPFRFASDGRLVPATAELLDGRLGIQVNGLLKALADDKAYEKAKWFAQITQNILNVTLLDCPEAGEWETRQSRFLSGASAYFAELQLTELSATVGQDYTRFKDAYTPLKYTPLKRDGGPAGRVFRVLARALQYTPNRAKFNGTLLYLA